MATSKPLSMNSRVSAEHAAMMEGGVSIMVAAVSDLRHPSVCRAFGCKVTSSGGRITVFMSQVEGAALVEDVRRTGAIAVMLSEPASHKAVQYKGKDAKVKRATANEVKIVEAYRRKFVSVVAPLGFDPQGVMAILSCPPSELVSISFTPESAFQQTPGPGAGAALGKGAR